MSETQSATLSDTEIAAWHKDRNSRQKGVSWHFTTDDARIKLAHLYSVPILEEPGKDAKEI